MPPTKHIIFLNQKAIIERGCTASELPEIPPQIKSIEFCYDFRAMETITIPPHIRTITLHEANDISVFSALRTNHPLHILLPENLTAKQAIELLYGNNPVHFSFSRKISFATEHYYQKDQYIKYSIEHLCDAFNQLNTNIQEKKTSPTKRALSDTEAPDYNQGLFKKPRLSKTLNPDIQIINLFK